MADEIETGRLVAAACKALGDVAEFKPPSGYPDSLANCIVDSIWSMGVKYGGVDNVLKRYWAWLEREGRGSATNRAAAQLVDDIGAAGGPQRFAKNVVDNLQRTSTRNGVLKAEAVAIASRELDGLGVHSAADLRERYTDPEVERAWKAVRGQRSGISWHYLLILANVEDVKADRMIRRFVATAANLGRLPSAEVAAAAVKDAHHMLRAEGAPNLTLRALDHAIWSAQRGR